jgi:hypothetical protein
MVFILELVKELILRSLLISNLTCYEILWFELVGCDVRFLVPGYVGVRSQLTAIYDTAFEDKYPATPPLLPLAKDMPLTELKLRTDFLDQKKVLMEPIQRLIHHHGNP